MRPLPRLLLALAALLLACGCSSRVETIAPKGDSPVALSTTSKRTTHTAKFAERILVTLPPADYSTHQWEISFHDARFTRQLSEFQSPPTEGAGATVAFLATRLGTTRIRFVLLPRGAQREATPIDGHDLVLTIE